MDVARRIRRPAAAGEVRTVAPRTCRTVVTLATVEGVLGERSQLLVALVAACVLDKRSAACVSGGDLGDVGRDHDQAADAVGLPDWRRRNRIALVGTRSQRIER